MPPSRPPHRRTRVATRLASAALGLFADTDPRRITIRQIADAAEVSVGSVYAQYGSKDGLYLAVLSDALELSARYTAGRRWSPSPLQRLFNVGEAYVQFAREHPEAFRLVVQRATVDLTAPGLAAQEARISHMIEAEVAGITADIEAAIQAGELIPLPVADVFDFLWGAWAGVLSLTLRRDRFRISGDDAERVLRGAQHALAKGLRPE